MRRDNPKRTPLIVIEQRREMVARLVARRLSIREITEALATQGKRNPATGEPWSRHAIHDDIRALEAQWRQQASAMIDEHKARQLSDIEEVIRQGWMDRDLGVVLSAMAQKAALLGLNAPANVNIEMRIREAAEAMGIDPDEAIREAQRIVKSAGAR